MRRDNADLKTSLAEYLFATDTGELENQIPPEQVDQIYNGYVNALLASYDRVKSKYNVFASKCLSDK